MAQVVNIGATSVPLAGTCQNLGITGYSLNSITQGNGKYWNANEGHAQGQTQSMSRIYNTTYAGVTGIQGQVATIQAGTPQVHVWVKGNAYGGSGQAAIAVAAPTAVYVLNQGYTIYGGGGAGGHGAEFSPGTAGGAGAQAITIQGATTKVLYNTGTIYGGGGGGGGGGCNVSGGEIASGGGGGGGVSYGAAGDSFYNLVNGQAATATTRGLGGPGINNNRGAVGGTGGAGGSAGQAGQAGAPGSGGSLYTPAGGAGAAGQGTANFIQIVQQGTRN